MHFLLLFQVISRSCFRLTPAAPTIVHSVLHGCPDWPVISIYTLRCFLSTIHARSSIQFIHLSGLCFPIRVMPNDQKESEGSSVPAEVGQTFGSTKAFRIFKLKLFLKRIPTPALLLEQQLKSVL